MHLCWFGWSSVTLESIANVTVQITRADRERVAQAIFATDYVRAKTDRWEDAPINVRIHYDNQARAVFDSLFDRVYLEYVDDQAQA